MTTRTNHVTVILNETARRLRGVNPHMRKRAEIREEKEKRVVVLGIRMAMNAPENIQCTREKSIKEKVVKEMVV